MENKKDTITIPIGKLKKINLWKILSLILVIILFLTLLNFTGKDTSVSKEVANQKVIDFAKKQGAENIKVLNTQEFENFYEIEISIDENSIPVYITKDGNYFIANTPIKI